MGPGSSFAPISNSQGIQAALLPVVSHQRNEVPVRHYLSRRPLGPDQSHDPSGGQVHLQNLYVNCPLPKETIIPSKGLPEVAGTSQLCIPRLQDRKTAPEANNTICSSLPQISEPSSTGNLLCQSELLPAGASPLVDKDRQPQATGAPLASNP